MAEELATPKHESPCRGGFKTRPYTGRPDQAGGTKPLDLSDHLVRLKREAIIKTGEPGSPVFSIRKPNLKSKQ
jgi:hypothetical protein